jgi:tRNA threonylcarbamoyladenosine biosynthesis protein TsaB
MTNILALDASTELCSVALLQGDKVLEMMSDKPRSHADRLLPMVDELLADAGCSLAQIDAIGFGAGPGSFTGLRICLGVVQGLAFGTGLPVVAVSSLEAMALAASEQESESGLLIPAIDARMNEVYWAVYEQSAGGLQIVAVPQVSGIAQAEQNISTLLAGRDATGVGTGWALLKASQGALVRLEENVWPQASAVAKLAKASFEAGNYADAMAAEPIYLRTEISWKKRDRIR